MSKKTIKPLSIALGTAFAASMAASNIATAAQGANPFVMNELSGGYMQVADANEGKCGGQKTAPKAKQEGQCGAAKKNNEGNCGGKKDMEKAMEGKCGGAKAEPKAKKEGKCGEGKCGGKK